jgi:hypothetical protein
MRVLRVVLKEVEAIREGVLGTTEDKVVEVGVVGLVLDDSDEGVIERDDFVAVIGKETFLELIGVIHEAWVFNGVVFVEV